MDYSSKLRAVRRLLLDEWDPIGVRDVPVAQDEYDQYLPAILVLLEQRASVEEIAQRLSDVVTLDMGLAELADRDLAVARRLALLRL